MIENSKDWFLFTCLILLFVTAFSWISFARFSMARIEKAIKEEDGSNSFAWDGIGVRTIFYAYAIALPERFAIRLEQRLIQSSLVRSYSSQFDHINALTFLVSSNLLVVACLVGWCIWGD